MQLNHYQIQLCKIQARLFALAYARGYDPLVFVSAFMRSESAAGLDAPFDRLQWAGELYLLEEVVESEHLEPSGVDDSLSADALFWAGYLYRYWHFVTGESSSEIYRQAPLDVMIDVYPGFHALSPEMAIDDLKGCARASETAL